jgi:hypothetical protein
MLETLFLNALIPVEGNFDRYFLVSFHSHFELEYDCWTD